MSSAQHTSVPARIGGGGNELALAGAIHSENLVTAAFEQRRQVLPDEWFVVEHQCSEFHCRLIFRRLSCGTWLPIAGAGPSAAFGVALNPTNLLRWPSLPTKRWVPNSRLFFTSFPLVPRAVILILFIQ